MSGYTDDYRERLKNIMDLLDHMLETIDTRDLSDDSQAPNLEVDGDGRIIRV